MHKLDRFATNVTATALVIVVAILIATCGCALRSGAGLAYARARAVTESASLVRFLTVCPDGSRWVGAGVAVSARRVVTARHVVDCDGALPVAVFIETADGHTFPAAVSAFAESGADVARVAVIGASPLTPARFAATPAPGDHVCVVVKDFRSGQDHVRKCGEVSAAGDDEIMVGVRPNPGNSGSPVFDDAGDVVAILHSGRVWAPGAEDYFYAAPVVTFTDLLEGR